MDTHEGLPSEVLACRCLCTTGTHQLLYVATNLRSLHWRVSTGEVHDGSKAHCARFVFSGGRVLVGMSGPAGAGKSTLAQLLCAACNILSGQRQFSQAVSMDAYSYPNAQLSAQPAEDHLGRACTLKDIKGQPKTLDCASLLRDLELLRLPSSQNILLPAYSRQLHDPVPDCVAVAPDCRVVIAEGICVDSWLSAWSTQVYRLPLVLVHANIMNIFFITHVQTDTTAGIKVWGRVPPLPPTEAACR